MKMQIKILFEKWRPFCPGGDELNNSLWLLTIIYMYMHSPISFRAATLTLGASEVTLKHMGKIDSYQTII